MYKYLVLIKVAICLVITFIIEKTLLKIENLFKLLLFTFFPVYLFLFPFLCKPNEKRVFCVLLIIQLITKNTIQEPTSVYLIDFVLQLSTRKLDFIVTASCKLPRVWLLKCCIIISRK